MAGLNNNLPQISAGAYASQTYSGLLSGIAQSGVGQALGSHQTIFDGSHTGSQHAPWFQKFLHEEEKVDSDIDRLVREVTQQQKPKQETTIVADPKRRLIKVIIVDPDDRVPLDKSVLYSGSEKLTDLTDQELFFEIDIKNVLDKHNADRIRIVDKTIKERQEYLEPVKVRELRMVVVTVASF